MKIRLLIGFILAQFMITVPARAISPANEPSEKAHLNILAIANSYAIDALAYLPSVLERSHPNIELKIVILYRARQSFESHYRHLNDTELYEPIRWQDGHWSTIPNINFGLKIADMFQNENWDIVILQQYSKLSDDFSTCFSDDGSIDYVQELINVCRNNGFEGQFAWLMPPAYPTTNFSLLKQNGDKMMDGIISATQEALEYYTDITILMPCGTAIHNARKTCLNDFGDCSTHELFCDDNIHLQPGVATLTEAYTVAMALFGTEAHYYKIETPEWPCYKHGDVQGMEAENQILARKCARNAVNDPWHYGPPVAVEDIYGNDQPTTGDVYTIDGRIVLHNVQNLDGLPAGIYITGHRKVVIK